MLKVKFLFFSLSLILPYVLIYKAFFTNSPLAFGDAPYFYPENLKELFQKPLLWDFRNFNFGSNQSATLWLFLPTFLLGALHHLTGLSNELLIRLIFYFPATILPILTSFLFIKKFIRNSFCIFLGVLFYSFNNYLLLLIDGGQIGLALSYGIFPLSLLLILDYHEKASFLKFIKASSLFVLLTNIDLRTSLLCFSTFLLMLLTRVFVERSLKVFKKLPLLFPIIILSFLVSSFWLLPLVNSFGRETFSIFGDSLDKDLTNISNGLFLFSPHFPKNEFGVIFPVHFYYLAVPILIFSGVFLNPKRKSLVLSLCALIFIFAVKGGILNNFPLALGFRDTTKFFIPLFLICATLLGLTGESLNLMLRKYRLSVKVAFILCYFYLFILIFPAFSNGLTGNLAGRNFNQDYSKIYGHFKSESEFFRTLWFPEKPPLAFSTQGKEAINANLLYKDLPFASMILGNYDLFYFLHDLMLSDWFKLLGIKYAFFPEDERKKTWTDRERYERTLFLNFVDNLGFEKLNWGTTFPAYQVSSPNPKIFGQEKIILALGGTDIYQYVKDKIADFSLSNQGFVFLEDGFSNPLDLLNLPNDSAIFISKKRDEKDLVFTFLQNSFLNDKNLSFSNFGKYGNSQYLDLKYELSRYGIESNDLVFGKGTYFSNVKGERIIFKSNLKNKEQYRLAFRSISASDSAGLKYKFGNNEGVVNQKERFGWQISEPFKLYNDSQQIDFENLGGFSAINIVATVSEDDYQNAFTLAKRFSEKFGDGKNINALSQLQPISIIYKEINPTKYEVNLSNNHPRWIVFSDHFDKGWVLNGSKAQPFYSMINGFLVSPNFPNHLTLEFSSQSDVDLGLKVSIISLGFLAFLGLVATLRTLR